MDEMEVQLCVRGLETVEFLLDQALRQFEPLAKAGPGIQSALIGARTECQNVQGYMVLCLACRKQGITVFEGIKRARAELVKQEGQ
jgi:hypothetical protein